MKGELKLEKEWYIAKSGVRLGPFTKEEVSGYLIQGQVNHLTKVWKKGFLDWDELGNHFPQGDGPPPLIDDKNDTETFDKENKAKANNKIAAGLCGIFLGSFGVHKFILGLNTPGLIMLLVSLLTCVGWPIMSIIGLIEGIIYLTKNDEDFVQTYVVDKKQWF